jgi:cytidine deaminase
MFAGLESGESAPAPLMPDAALPLASRGARPQECPNQVNGKGQAMSLRDAAVKVRQTAYAPYSGFPVGAALRGASGGVHVGCNVENVSYPEGTCAEAGAIAAMVAAGETAIAEVYVVADSPDPVTPCGGCRQRIAEFAGPEVRVTMSNLEGREIVMTVADLLPGAFDRAHLARG